jgi:membrane-associated phospholipid phosphatase
VPAVTEPVVGATPRTTASDEAAAAVSRPAPVWSAVLPWVLAFAVALTLDRHVAECVARVQPIRWDDWELKIFKRAGEFQYTVAVVALVALLHRRRWRAALLLLAVSGAAGLLYNVKWFIGRVRPDVAVQPFTFHPFPGGPLGIFTAKNLAMPSGHTCFAFATVHTLAWLMPRWRWPLYVVAGLVGVERVLENAHYVSDVVAGAAVGVFAAFLVIKLLSPTLGLAGPTSPAPTKP